MEWTLTTGRLRICRSAFKSSNDFSTNWPSRSILKTTIQSVLLKNRINSQRKIRMSIIASHREATRWKIMRVRMTMKSLWMRSCSPSQTIDLISQPSRRKMSKRRSVTFGLRWKCQRGKLWTLASLVRITASLPWRQRLVAAVASGIKFNANPMSSTCWGSCWEFNSPTSWCRHCLKINLV